MTYFPILLIIISLYGGVSTATFESMEACEVAKGQIAQINVRTYCVDRRSR